MAMHITVYLVVLMISLFIIKVSQRDYFSSFIKKFCETKGFIEFFIVLFMITGIIFLIIHLFLSIYLYFFPMDKSDLIIFNIDQDPVRWWPSGLVQSWGIIGAVISAYKLIPGHSRIKAMAGLAALGVSIPTVIFSQAVENPNGFNRLMHSWVTYKNTGEWPSYISDKVSDNILDEMTNKVVTNSDNTTHHLFPDNFDIFELFNNIIPKSLKSFVMNLFRPVEVEGYLDDLLGQQLFIHFLLIILIISLILLLILYIYIQVLNNYKEFILNKFNNKFIIFYIKYQIVLIRISTIIIPLIFMFGLIQLLIGLHFLVTHPIPYDQLGIDLHTYISKKK